MKNGKGSNGITLIALVITIIVLLILAAVSIATLTGDNGILTKSIVAKEEIRYGSVKEERDLWKVNKTMYTNAAETMEKLLDRLEAENMITNSEREQIETTGKVTIANKEIVFGPMPLPYTNETKPYYPDDECYYVEGDLDSGLVIADSRQNEYVWIEVPKSITESAVTNDELYNVLNEYSKDYKDTWNWGLTNSDIWYEECGLSEDEYNTNYTKMLNSIKENGGFYIGRYTMGSETPRTEESASTKSGVKINMYPYNWVEVSKASQICKTYSLANTTSSLMFDIQYNLVCRYLKEKSELTYEDIAVNSNKWGNYFDSEFELQRGKYQIHYDETGTWYDYNVDFNEEYILLGRNY